MPQIQVLTHLADFTVTVAVTVTRGFETAILPVCLPVCLGYNF